MNQIVFPVWWPSLWPTPPLCNGPGEQQTFPGPSVSHGAQQVLSQDQWTYRNQG